VGISSRGGAVDLLTQLILTHHGLTPNKDELCWSQALRRSLRWLLEPAVAPRVFSVRRDS
jgi:hypothetical protein